MSLVSQLSDDPFVNLDNRFTDVVATESVAEYRHEFLRVPYPQLLVIGLVPSVVVDYSFGVSQIR